MAIQPVPVREEEVEVADEDRVVAEEGGDAVDDARCVDAVGGTAKEKSGWNGRVSSAGQQDSYRLDKQGKY